MGVSKENEVRVSKVTCGWRTGTGIVIGLPSRADKEVSLAGMGQKTKTTTLPITRRHLEATVASDSSSHFLAPSSILVL